MLRSVWFAAVVFAAAAMFSPHRATAQARGGTLSIPKAIIANGGGESSGGTLRVTGTIAQVSAGPVPGGQMTGGTLRVRGGFWPEDESAPPDALFANGFE